MDFCARFHPVGVAARDTVELAAAELAAFEEAALHAEAAASREMPRLRSVEES